MISTYVIGWVQAIHVDMASAAVPYHFFTMCCMNCRLLL